MDSTLTDAVEKHNGKYWPAISELVPDRTKQQCRDRWRNGLYPRSDGTTARKARWTKEEDSTLKDTVGKHNGKNWAELVPGRTDEQCRNRWRNALHSKTGETTACTGKWTSEEDAKLKDAVKKHNGKNWAAIAKLVPGQTEIQCYQHRRC
jgi:myb proto-oncogene protein